VVRGIGGGVRQQRVAPHRTRRVVDGLTRGGLDEHRPFVVGEVMSWVNVSGTRISMPDPSFRIGKKTITLSAGACAIIGKRVSVLLDGKRIAFAPASEGQNSNVLRRLKDGHAGRIVREFNKSLMVLPVTELRSLVPMHIEGYGECLVGELPS